MYGIPGPPAQCYLGYAYACSNRPPPPLSAKVRCVKSIRLDLFLLYTSLFQHPPPPFSAKVRCVKSIRLDLFLLLRKGHFGNTHAVILKPEWGGGGGGRDGITGINFVKATKEQRSYFYFNSIPNDTGIPLERYMKSFTCNSKTGKASDK